MGSSKKHGKEKEKEKERERKKHRAIHVSREKDHSSHHRKRRSRSPERSKHSFKRRRGDSDSDSGRIGHNKTPRKDPIEVHTISDDEEFEVKGSGESLSVDDTNKLRAKLGLKPLQVHSGIPGLGKDPQDEEDSDDDKEEERKEVFVQTENIREKKRAELLREKLQVAREKRKLIEKLGRVKGIADSESEDDNAEKWIEKSRKIQEEKNQASKRAKLLEEMDEEFGVAALVEEEFLKAKQKTYGMKDLKGLAVGHNANSFKEGQLAVLVLKDQGVLEEDDDVLINVNMVDDEKAAQNVENKKNKPDYVAYDEPEYDEFGILKTKKMLSKYDEELDGPKKETFKIGMNKVLDKERELEIVRMKLKQKQQGVETLELPALRIATEYYTPEEMVAFKKPKKKKKVMRKRVTLKPEELASITGVQESVKDHGSRSRKNRPVDNEEPKELISVLQKDNDTYDMDIDNSEMLHSEMLEPQEDLTGVLIDDDKADLELEMALDKTRKLKQHQGAANNLEQLARRIKNENNDEESNPTDEEKSDKNDNKINIVLNSVAEFCRTLGDIPTYGLSGNREVDADETIDFEQEMAGEDWKPQDIDLPRGAWNEVEVKEQPVEISKERENEPILEDEPEVFTVGGALKLAMKKGYLDDDGNKLASAPRHSALQAQSYTIEEKFYDDDKFGRRDRYTGPIQDFRERDHYKPDVKLEYIDDNGRLLNAKEAFRYLSHKFHGKGPGKNKVDKRTKKLDQESKLKLMSSTDTPLNTLKLLQEKQKDLQTPYILLSGGSKALTQTSITKTK